MDIKKYKELHKQVAVIVNEVDPCYYAGPDDEYDHQVNGVLKLIELGETLTPKNISDLFFAKTEEADDEQQSKINEIIDRVSRINKE